MMTTMPHHYRDREGRLINNLQWRALRTDGECCVLAQYCRATERIEAVWHGDGERYDFALRILGGKHHGMSIQCSTEKSVMAFFDATVAARKDGREPWWLMPIEIQL